MTLKIFLEEADATYMIYCFKKILTVVFLRTKNKVLVGLIFGVSFSLLFLPFWSYADKQPAIWNLSIENLFFVEREKQLHAMQSSFSSLNKIGHILALTGGPGFGKTQMAKHYAYQFCKDYDLIWWVDAQQDIPNQFAKLALALNHLLPDKEQIIPSTMSKDVLIYNVKSILSHKKIRYLLIFDNAENYNQVVDFFPSTYDAKGKHVLLTSRDPNIWPNKVEMVKFDRPESISLIKYSLPQEKEEDMERLADALSDHPLGLTIAVGVVKSSPTATIRKFLSIDVIEKTLKNKADPPNPALDQYPYTAQAALVLSLKAIEERSSDALHALFFMSLLNSKDIPETYIEILLKQAKSFLTADEAIGYIYGQSLIGVSETTEFNGKGSTTGEERVHYLSVHDWIHQLINEQLSIEEKRKLIDTATDVMLKVFAGPSEIFMKKILNERIHLLHAQKLCERAKSIGYSSNNLLKLKACILECLIGGIRDIEIAKLYLEDIEKDLSAGFKIEPYYMALLAINKGFFAALLPHYEEAIRCLEEGLTILDSLQEVNEEKLRALALLAQYYASLGETEIALTFIEQGKDIFKRSKAESFNCLFLYVWSIILNDKSKFIEALNVLEKVKAYPTLHINTPIISQAILHQEAEILIKLGRFEEAERALNECEKRNKIFFQGRTNTIFADCQLFKVLLSIKKHKPLKKIFQLMQEIFQIYEETYQGTQKHWRQARAHLIMGKSYIAIKEYKKALQEYLFGEETYNMVLKKKRIDDVSELYKELAILGTQLKDEGLTHKYLKSHIDIFGLTHPRTKEIIQYLDSHKISL